MNVNLFLKYMKRGCIMGFKEFLNEQRENDYKTEISIEQAKEIFKKYCKNCDLERPLWRGMRGKNPSFILEGNKGSRKSINAKNYYTLLIDHFVQKKFGPNYPLRSKAIICASNSEVGEVTSFGPDVYAIFPYDDVLIGVFPKADVWAIKFTQNGVSLGSMRLNGMYEDAGIPDTNYESIVSALKKYMSDENTSKSDRLYKVFEGQDVEKTLEEMYIDGLQVEFINNKKAHSLRDAREMWISGKCLAIKKEVYFELKKEFN